MAERGNEHLPRGSKSLSRLPGRPGALRTEIAHAALGKSPFAAWARSAADRQRLPTDLTKAWRSRRSWLRTAPDRLTTGRRPPDMSLTPLAAFILPAWPVYGGTGAQRGL